MSVLDDITELAQDVYFTINNAENDDTDEDLDAFINGFIRSFNIWIREYETEAYWTVARVNDLVLATISNTTNFSFDLSSQYRTPIFDQNKELKFVLPDGTIISRFALVNPDQRQVDPDPLRANRATFLANGRGGGGKVILSRPPKTEEIGAKIVLDVVKLFPKLARNDGTVLDWIYNTAVATYGIAKNQTLADVTKVSLSPSFAQKYSNELNKALNINNASNEIDDMQRDNFGHIGGIW